MVANVDSSVKYGNVGKAAIGDFGKEMKAVNSQLIVVFNTLFTVGGAFVFGYKGIDWIVPGIYSFLFLLETFLRHQHHQQVSIAMNTNFRLH